MNQEPEQSSSHHGNRTRHIVASVIFTIVWLGACAFFGVSVFMGDLFELADGGYTQTQDIVFLIIQLVGFVLAAIAGILGGASYYCPSHRKRLLWLFWTLLVAGVLVFISSTFVLGFIFVLAAILGILGGASYYCPSHRKRLLWLFWTLLVAGALFFISSFIFPGLF